MAGKKIVGTWTLLSAEARCSDGQIIQIYGENPKGLIIYDAIGYVSVNLMRSDREPFAEADKAKCTPQEAKYAIETYEAYFGTYRVDERKKMVIHHINGSLLPNWTGSDQVRYYEFSNDCLILRTAEIPYGCTIIVEKLVWKQESLSFMGPTLF